MKVREQAVAELLEFDQKLVAGPQICRNPSWSAALMLKLGCLVQNEDSVDLGTSYENKLFACVRTQPAEILVQE